MIEIGHGIDVFHENERNVGNKVVLSNGSWLEYKTGDMILELMSNEARYLLVEKPPNMIRLFPDGKEPVTPDTVKNGFRWLYALIEDETLPIATDLFRSVFDDAIHEVYSDESSLKTCRNVTDFFFMCYDQYLLSIETFDECLYAMAATASGIADEAQISLATRIKVSVTEMYDIYTKHKRGRRTPDGWLMQTHGIRSPIELLTFELCGIEKEHKALKICEYCGLPFVTLNRRKELYCRRVIPERAPKTCHDYGTTAKRKDELTNDPKKALYYRERTAARVAKCRAIKANIDFQKQYDRMLMNARKKYEGDDQNGK